MNKNVKLFDRKQQIRCLSLLANTITSYRYTEKVYAYVSSSVLGSDGILADSIYDLFEDITVMRRQRRKYVYCSFESMSLVALVVLVGMPDHLERELHHLIDEVNAELDCWVWYWSCGL